MAFEYICVFIHNVVGFDFPHDIEVIWRSFLKWPLFSRTMTNWPSINFTNFSDFEMTKCQGHIARVKLMAQIS